MNQRIITTAFVTVCAITAWTSAALAQTALETPHTGSGHRAYIDPATGDLAPPPHSSAVRRAAATAAKPADPNGNSAKAARFTPPPAASRAWEEDGMQVIELAPARRTSVYATRGADGRIETTHVPAAQMHDD